MLNGSKKRVAITIARDEGRRRRESHPLNQVCTAGLQGELLEPCEKISCKTGKNNLSTQARDPTREPAVKSGGEGVTTDRRRNKSKIKSKHSAIVHKRPRFSLFQKNRPTLRQVSDYNILNNSIIKLCCSPGQTLTQIPSLTPSPSPPSPPSSRTNRMPSSPPSS